MASQKTKNLIILKKKRRSEFLIPDFYILELKKYFQNKEKYLNIIQKRFSKKSKIILRSSSASEDGKLVSNAGKYISLISSLNKKELIKNISLISLKLNNQDQIIAQEYIYQPKFGGVIFTRDINDNSPYYILNIDYSKKTNLVTSGLKNVSMKTFIVHRSLKYVEKKFIKLFKAVKIIEKIFKSEKLDIEFAYKNNKIYIFQCRTLNFNYKNKNINIDKSLNIIAKKIEKLKKPLPFISGTKNIFSNMSDWNPAEILGIKPSQLGISLYEKLITNDVWSKQRHKFGYKNVKPYPLMYNLGGSTYIDLRIDLNSFLIKRLNKNISNKIINYYINKISKNPKIHDKIEYEIFPTYFSLNKKRYKELKQIIGSKSLLKYKKELKRITVNSFFNKNNLIDENKKINLLRNKLTEIRKSKASLLHKIYLTLNFTKEYGTLVFASMARKAFISTNYINDLKELKILSSNDVDKIYSSMNTISKKIQMSLKLLQAKKISKVSFLREYGHLRPSTYSIKSKNYKNNFNNYFNLKKKIQLQQESFNLSKIQDKKITKKLHKNNFNIDSKTFLNLLKEYLKNREYFKLIFTIGVDDIFNYIQKLQKRLKISKNDLEFINIDILLNNFNNLSLLELKKIIKENINFNKKQLYQQQYIKLPDLIKDKKDLFFFEKYNLKGNFITQKKVTAKTLIYNNQSQDLNNKIVILENADPGYDFIFSHRIKGLITKYGGPNSHMAIRCSEYQLPAIIGMTQDFEKFKNNQIVTIDSYQKVFLNHE